tara:strand:+ start:143 stop:604 length:462 start_codon:yes stop_codon:yes gene_type:complete
MPNIRIDQQLFPVTGLSTTPETPEGEVRLVGEVQPRLAILAALGTAGLVAVEATDDGAVKTADTGAGLTAVEVSSGIADDAATALSLAAAYTRITITVENFGLDLAFQFTSGSWSGDLVLSVGVHELEITGQDVRLNNSTAGQSALYKVWSWS